MLFDSSISKSRIPITVRIIPAITAKSNIIPAIRGFKSIDGLSNNDHIDFILLSEKQDIIIYEKIPIIIAPVIDKNPPMTVRWFNLIPSFS